MTINSNISNVCSECPRIIANLKLPCIGQYVLDRSYCRKAKELDQVAISRILTWLPPISEVTYTTDSLEFQISAMPLTPELIRPKFIETVALLSRMKACPHWHPSSECGCGINLCSAGKGAEGKVTHNDCFNCQCETNSIIAANHRPTAGYDS